MDKSKVTGRVVTLVFYVLVAACLTWIHIIGNDLNESSRQTFAKMIDGTAARPYVYRVFMPGAINAIEAITPQQARPIAEKVVAKLGDRVSWERDYALEYLICAALVFGCYMGFLFTMRGFVGEFYPAHADFAPVFAGLVLILFFRYTATLYDPGTLLLFPLGTLLAYQRRVVAFSIVFVVACLNKETACLLVWLFLIRMWDVWPVRKVFAFCAAYAAAWLGIKWGLEHAFASNAGALTEWHLFDHNLILLSKYPLSALYTVLVLGLFGWLVARGWKDSPMFLKVGLVGVFMPLFGAAFLWGKLDEIRDYYEAIPLAFVIAMRAVVKP